MPEVLSPGFAFKSSGGLLKNTDAELYHRPVTSKGWGGVPGPQYFKAPQEVVI